jgi:glycine betaine/choline ABC-type transport system substrate-binding protein
MCNQTNCPIGELRKRVEELENKPDWDEIHSLNAAWDLTEKRIDNVISQFERELRKLNGEPYAQD